MSIEKTRREYQQNLEFLPLPDPLELFANWYAVAANSTLLEPNAMALATVSPSGHPSVRMVLLKGFDSTGFRFFTNLESRKAEELRVSPQAALCIYWDLLDRQVRVCGSVEQLPRQDVDAYFAHRPRGAQIAAWISKQSSVVASAEQLQASWEKFDLEHPDDPLSTPPHWGGYRLVPEEMEFWQGSRNRLHNRVRYHLGTDETWQYRLLYP